MSITYHFDPPIGLFVKIQNLIFRWANYNSCARSIEFLPLYEFLVEPLISSTDQFAGEGNQFVLNLFSKFRERASKWSTI